MHSFLTYLWLIPALPMTGFIILVGAGEWLSKRMIVWIGVGSVGLSEQAANAMAAMPATGIDRRSTASSGRNRALVEEQHLRDRGA